MTVRYHLPFRMAAIKTIRSVGKVVGKLEHLFIAGGNITYAAAVKNSMEFLKKLSIELLYDPAVPFLAVRPKEV